MPPNLDSTKIVPDKKGPPELGTLMNISWPINQEICISDNIILEPSVNVKVLKSKKKYKQSQIEIYMREYQESENQNEILAEREPLGIFHLSELSKLKIDINSNHIYGCRVKIDECHSLTRSPGLLQTCSQSKKSITQKSCSFKKRKLSVVSDHSVELSPSRDKKCIKDQEVCENFKCNCQQGDTLIKTQFPCSDKREKRKVSQDKCREETNSSPICRDAKSKSRCSCEQNPRRQLIKNCFRLNTKPLEMSESDSRCILVKQSKQPGSHPNLELKTLIVKSLASLCCALKVNAEDVKKFQARNKSSLGSVLRQTENNLRSKIQCQAGGSNTIFKLLNSFCVDEPSDTTTKLSNSSERSANCSQKCNECNAAAVSSICQCKAKFSVSREISTNSSIKCAECKSKCKSSNSSSRQCNKCAILSGNCSKSSSSNLPSLRRPAKTSPHKRSSRTPSLTNRSNSVVTCDSAKGSTDSTSIYQTRNNSSFTDDCSFTDLSTNESRERYKTADGSIITERYKTANGNGIISEKYKTAHGNRTITERYKTAHGNRTTNERYKTAHGNRISERYKKTANGKRRSKIYKTPGGDGIKDLCCSTKCLDKVKKVLQNHEKKVEQYSAAYCEQPKNRNCRKKAAKSPSHCRICMRTLRMVHESNDDGLIKNPRSSSSNLSEISNYKLNNMSTKSECTDYKPNSAHVHDYKAPYRHVSEKSSQRLSKRNNVLNRANSTETCKISTEKSTKCEDLTRKKPIEKCDRISSSSANRTDNSVRSPTLSESCQDEDFKSINTNTNVKSPERYTCKPSKEMISRHKQTPKDEIEWEQCYKPVLDKLEKTLTQCHKLKTKFSESSEQYPILTRAAGSYKTRVNFHVKDKKSCKESEKIIQSDSRYKTAQESKAPAACTAHTKMTVESVCSVLGSGTNLSSSSSVCVGNRANEENRNNNSQCAIKMRTQISGCNVTPCNASSEKSRKICNAEDYSKIGTNDFCLRKDPKPCRVCGVDNSEGDNNMKYSSEYKKDSKYSKPLNDESYSMRKIEDKSQKTKLNMCRVCSTARPSRSTCNQSNNRQSSSRSTCNQTNNRQSSSRSTCNQTNNRQSSSRSTCNQTNNRQSSSRSTCNQINNRQNSSLSTCNQTTNRQSSSRSTCNQINNRQSSSRSTCNQTNNRRSSSRSTCNQTNNRQSSSQSTCNQTNNRQSSSRSTCNQTNNRLSSSQSTCNQKNNNRQIPSRSTCYQKNNRQIPSRSTCYQKNNRQIPSRSTCYQKNNRQIPSRSTCYQKNNIQIPSRSTCNQKNNRQIPSRSTCNQKNNRQIPSRSTCNQKNNRQIPSRSNCYQKNNRQEQCDLDKLKNTEDSCSDYHSPDSKTENGNNSKTRTIAKSIVKLVLSKNRCTCEKNENCHRHLKRKVNYQESKNKSTHDSSCSKISRCSSNRSHHVDNRMENEVIGERDSKLQMKVQSSINSLKVSLKYSECTCIKANNLKIRSKHTMNGKLDHAQNKCNSSKHKVEERRPERCGVCSEVKSNTNKHSTCKSKCTKCARKKQIALQIKYHHLDNGQEKLKKHRAQQVERRSKNNRKDCIFSPQNSFILSVTNLDLQSDYPLLDDNNLIKCKKEERGCKPKRHLYKVESINRLNRENPKFDSNTYIRKERHCKCKDQIKKSKRKEKHCRPKDQSEMKNLESKVKCTKSEYSSKKRCLELEKSTKNCEKCRKCSRLYNRSPTLKRETSRMKTEIPADIDALICSSRGIPSKIIKCHSQYHSMSKSKTPRKTCEKSKVKFWIKPEYKHKDSASNCRKIQIVLKDEGESPNDRQEPITNQAESNSSEYQNDRNEICMKDQRSKESQEICQKYYKYGDGEDRNMSKKNKRDPCKINEKGKYIEFLNELKNMHCKIVQKRSMKETVGDNCDTVCATKKHSRINEENKCDNNTGSDVKCPVKICIPRRDNKHQAEPICNNKDKCKGPVENIECEESQVDTKNQKCATVIVVDEECKKVQDVCEEIKRENDKETCEQETEIHVDSYSQKAIVPKPKENTKLHCSCKVKCNCKSKSKKVCKSKKNTDYTRQDYLWKELKDIMKLVADTKTNSEQWHNESDTRRRRSKSERVKSIGHKDLRGTSKRNECLPLFNVNLVDARDESTRINRSLNREKIQSTRTKSSCNRTKKEEELKRKTCETGKKVTREGISTKSAVPLQTPKTGSSRSVHNPLFNMSTCLSHTEIYYTRHKQVLHKKTTPLSHKRIIIKTPLSIHRNRRSRRMTTRLFGKTKQWKLRRKGIEESTEIRSSGNTDHIESNQPVNCNSNPARDIGTLINNAELDMLEINHDPKSVDSDAQSDNITTTTNTETISQPTEVAGESNMLTTDDKIDYEFNRVYAVLESYFNENQTLLDTVSQLTPMDHLTDLLNEIDFATDYPLYLREQSLCEVNRFEEKFERFVARTQQVTYYQTFNQHLTRQTSSLATVDIQERRSCSSQAYFSNRFSIYKNKHEMSTMPKNVSFLHDSWNKRS